MSTEKSKNQNKSKFARKIGLNFSEIFTLYRISLKIPVKEAYFRKRGPAKLERTDKIFDHKLNKIIHFFVVNNLFLSLFFYFNFKAFTQKREKINKNSSFKCHESR